MENAAKCMEVAGGVWTPAPTSRVYFNIKIISVLPLCSNSFLLVVLVIPHMRRRGEEWNMAPLQAARLPEVTPEQAGIIPHWM